MRFGTGPAVEFGSPSFPRIILMRISVFVVTFRRHIVIAIDFISRMPYMGADLASARRSALIRSGLALHRLGDRTTGGGACAVDDVLRAGDRRSGAVCMPCVDIDRRCGHLEGRGSHWSRRRTLGRATPDQIGPSANPSELDSELSRLCNLTAARGYFGNIEEELLTIRIN
jgi:hypothetical protein